MDLRLDYLPGREDIKLYQDHNMICINTDTYVLGEYLEVYKFDTVLDIGTNNGALLLYANRFNPKKLIGLDINIEALEIAKKNLELNHISNYELVNVDASNYQGELVDVIICNPPYFKGGDLNKSKSKNMSLAKHEDSLKLEPLIKTIFNNLVDNGKLFFLYQSSRLQELIVLLNKYHLVVKEMKFVYNVNKDNSNVTLIKAVKNGKIGMEVKKPIMIKDMKVIDYGNIK